MKGTSIFVGHCRDSLLMHGFRWMVLVVLLVSASAQAFGDEGEPSVTVDIYVVDELLACAPNGYRQDSEVDNVEQTKCDELTTEKVKKWEELGIAYLIAQSIPPESISLGDTIFGKLVEYERKCPIEPSWSCFDPEKRISVVLIFDFSDKFSNPGGLAVDFERIPNKKKNNMTSYRIGGKLSPKGTWINHQRADAFFPSYDVSWELNVGEESWWLGTEP